MTTTENTRRPVVEGTPTFTPDPETVFTVVPQVGACAFDIVDGTGRVIESHVSRRDADWFCQNMNSAAV